jgi:hypothetical protein
MLTPGALKRPVESFHKSIHFRLSEPLKLKLHPRH